MATLTSPAKVGPDAAKAIVGTRADLRGTIIATLLLSALLMSMAFLVVLTLQLLVVGRSVLTSRLWDFLTAPVSTVDPSTAGIGQGLWGTLILVVIVAVVAFPLGVGCAVYLEEYASRTSRFAGLLSVNIRNLAGVPSIVYGLLGLAIFTSVLGRSVIAGGLTLAVLVLPIVIITAQEALRAVPDAIRMGSLALGATQWETVRSHVLPAAAPGILTGTVLSLARAAGEAAPILVAGAVAGAFFSGGMSLWEQITTGSYTALPMVIFTWARLPANAGWPALAAAAGFVLVVLLIIVNGVAIWLRNRYETKW